MTSDIKYQHKILAAKLSAKISKRKKIGRPIDPRDANELEFHRTSMIEDVQELVESYNFFLYYAQKADEAGKDVDSIRKHLLNAEKSRLRLKKFDVEKNKVRLAKEMWLRKKYNLPV